MICATGSITFAYIKSTEGGDWTDPRFEEYWRGAKAENILVGPYHFFTFCKSGTEQARNMIEVVPFEEIDLPPAIDLEYKGNCSRRPSQEELITEVESFSREIINRTGSKPIIYTTPDFYNDYLEGHLMDHQIWYRDLFFSEPVLKDGRSWVFWQYGVIPIDGIQGPVDRNVYNGDLESFRIYVRKI